MKCSCGNSNCCANGMIEISEVEKFIDKWCWIIDDSNDNMKLFDKEKKELLR